MEERGSKKNVGEWKRVWETEMDIDLVEREGHIEGVGE